ncbi:YkgJ family cysteine cluster protein [Candidatus Ozemobacteraceae bacterium]|nr:YkgJ family cysteine cluster protein [Candidatus Ozemobacteraceae bacterium]
MTRLYKKFITSFTMQVKRRYLMLLKKDAIADGLKRRRGECKGCGECCKASFNCPFLYKHGDMLLCQIHETKPEVCKTYPFNEQDVFPHTVGKCGYYFVKDETEDK